MKYAGRDLMGELIFISFFQFFFRVTDKDDSTGVRFDTCDILNKNSVMKFFQIS